MKERERDEGRKRHDLPWGLRRSFDRDFRSIRRAAARRYPRCSPSTMCLPAALRNHFRRPALPSRHSLSSPLESLDPFFSASASGSLSHRCLEGDVIAACCLLLLSGFFPSLSPSPQPRPPFIRPSCDQETAEVASLACPSACLPVCLRSLTLRRHRRPPPPLSSHATVDDRLYL